jgi:hypothetical protein
VTLSQTLRNDEIERASERLSRGESEEMLGAGIPQPDYTVRIADDDGIAECLHELLVAG